MEHSRHRQLFIHMVQANRWDRVLELGPQVLEDDPDDGFAHQMLTLAAIHTGDLDRADHHSQAALRLEPDAALPHQLRARYHRARNRLLDAKRCLLVALEREPRSASVWEEYAWNCYSRGDTRAAKKAAQTARSLDPENADLENLETTIASALDSPERLTAFETIEAYQHALRTDPNNPAILHNIGLTYLDDLDDGKNAIPWLRQAAALDPTEPRHQRALRRAVTRHDPVLRVINFPANHIKRAMHRFEERSVRLHPLALIALIPLFILGGFVAFLVGSLWFAFLLVPGKIYEFLSTPEIIRTAIGATAPDRSTPSLAVGFGAFAGRQPPALRWLFRLPRGLRLALFPCISLPLCFAVFWLLTNPRGKDLVGPLASSALLVGMVIGLIVSYRKHR